MKYEKQDSRVRAGVGVVACAMLALGGIAIGDLGTQTALASDNKVISGHACAPEGDDWKTDRSNPRFLESMAPGPQTYMCPVVRDDTTGQLDFVRVRTENRGSSSIRPECTVHSVSVDGDSIDSEMEEAPATLGFHTLKFSLNGFTEYDNGHYVIECRLGKDDRIISYRTNEK